LLSYDNTPEIYDLYHWAFIESVDTKYTINNNTSNINELLISNYR